MPVLLCSTGPSSEVIGKVDMCVLFEYLACLSQGRGEWESGEGKGRFGDSGLGGRDDG